MLAVLEVHRGSSSLGFPIPWNAECRGKPLLLSTVEALAASALIDTIAIAVASGDNDFERAVATLLAQARTPETVRLVVRAEMGRDFSHREHIARLRRLAPNAWRAGWAIPFAFAEHADPVRLLKIVEREGVEEMLLVPAHAPYLSAARLDELIAAREESRDAEIRLSTLPPGISGDVISMKYLRSVVYQDAPIDHLVRFLPDVPERDLDTKGAFHWYAGEHSALHHRLTCESKRSLVILERIGDWRERRVAAAESDERTWLDDLAHSPDSHGIFAGPVPSEVRMRVTNRRRASKPTVFDTRPEQSPARGCEDSVDDIDPALVVKVARELGEWGDVRLHISGGEPLLHPHFDDVLRAARARGVGSMILETDGLDLSDATVDLVSSCVDVVVVQLDAAQRGTYTLLHGCDRFEEAERGVERLLECTGETGGPSVAVEFREVEENKDETEAFLDRWFSKTPWVIVSRFRDYAGQLDRRPLHQYRMAKRVPCVHLEESLVIYPDGRAGLCDNDLDLAEPAGDLRTQSVEEVWTGRPLSELRAAHAGGEWNTVALCAGCDDWCRRG